LEWIGIEAVRIDFLYVAEKELVGRLAQEAQVLWEGARRVEAERLMLELAEAPVLVGQELRQTAAGCDALLERVPGLRAILKRGGSWTAEQIRLMHDCLGTPPELRPSSERLGPAGTVEPGRALVACRRAVAALKRRKAEVVDDVDARRRAGVEAGIG